MEWLKYVVRSILPLACANLISFWSYVLKVHKRETFVGSDFEFCTFLHSVCLTIKVFLRKTFNLTIVQEAIIFPRILSTLMTELSLYSVCAELS